LNSKKPTGENGSSPVYTYLRTAFTFGITLAMNIYLLSFLLGGWLDAKFGTSFVFRLIFFFFAMISGFYYLWKRIKSSERIEAELKEVMEKEAAEKEELERKKELLRRGLK
jgi:hypothetical protein